MAREKLGLVPVRDRVSEISRIYGRMKNEISKELMGIDMSDYRELKAISIQNRIDVLIKRLNRAVMKWARSAVLEAYKESMAKSRVSLEVLGMDKAKDFNNEIHNRTVIEYIDKITDDFLTANVSIKNMVNTYLYLAKKASSGLAQIQAFDVGDEVIISEIIQDAMAEGKSRVYASNRIYEYLRLKLLDGKFIDRKGRHYELTAYSKNVARTRLREAQTQGVKNMCEQYGDDLVRVSKHANPCDICKPLEDKIFSLSGTHPKYPLLPKFPPHNQCEHSIAPTSEIAIKFREKYQ